MKISFSDWSRHIYLPSIAWQWDRADAFPYLGQERNRSRRPGGLRNFLPIATWRGGWWQFGRACNAENFSGRVVLCPWSTIVLGAPHSPLSLLIGPIPWPYWIPCSYLPNYLILSQAFGNPFVRRRGDELSLAVSCWAGLSWGPGFPLPALCQGVSREGCGPHGKWWWLVQGLYECCLAGILVASPFGGLFVAFWKRWA